CFRDLSSCFSFATAALRSLDRTNVPTSSPSALYRTALSRPAGRRRRLAGAAARLSRALRLQQRRAARALAGGGRQGAGPDGLSRCRRGGRRVGALPGARPGACAGVLRGVGKAPPAADRPGPGAVGGTGLDAVRPRPPAGRADRQPVRLLL